MNTDLKLHEDPLFYEFENEAEAAAYDTWFRAKVQEGLDTTEPPIPHDEVMALINKKRQQRKAVRDRIADTSKQNTLLS